MSPVSVRELLPRDGWARAIVAGVAVGVLVTGLAAIGAVRSRTAIRAAAVASLTNYASVAAEQFANGYEAIIRQSFVPIIPTPGYVDPPGRRDPLPVADMVEMIGRLRIDPCHCMVSPSPTAVFRLGLDSNDTEAVDSAGGRLAGLDSAIAAATHRASDSLGPTGARYGFVLVPKAGGDQFVFFTRRADSVSGRRYVYGIVVPAAVMAERVYATAFRTIRLVPRYLLSTVARNDQYLEVEVLRRDGTAVYSSGRAYGGGPTDALVLPVIRGGVAIAVRLNPALKDALMPGGVPAPVPVRELILIGLSLGLLVTIGAFGIRAAELARLRSDFASSVTHELRTPLTQIRLAAETVLLGRSRSAEAAARSLTSVVAETRRLQHLIDNVLHFSRAERRLTRVRVEPLDLVAALYDVAGLFAPLVADRGIAVRVEAPEELTICADPNALRQVLLNLLDNAARFGPDQQPIRLGACRRGAEMEIWVEDQGPGIPVRDRERVWRAFVRLGHDRESGSTGTGLGLAVVKELVEAQRGRCWLETGSVGGTRVIVRLAAGEAAV